MAENGQFPLPSALCCSHERSRAAYTRSPIPKVCEKARLSRDARFDGLFFTAVRSTGIYCRPVCPAPAPKAANVRYYATAAAAAAAGYRPCLRCRPELAPGAWAWRSGNELVAGALRWIEDGLLDRAPVATLAERTGLSERHLRRLFADTLGASPLQVAATRRLLFARKLLDETALPVTDIAWAPAMAACAASTRPSARVSAWRRARCDGAGSRPDAQGVRLRLGFRPPYDFEAMLRFLDARSVPGIEKVDAQGYERVFMLHDAPGHLRVTAIEGEPALQLVVRHPHADVLTDVVARVRRTVRPGCRTACHRPWAVRRSVAQAGIAPTSRHPGARQLGRLRDRGARGTGPAGQRGRRAHAGLAHRRTLGRAPARRRGPPVPRRQRCWRTQRWKRPA